MFYAYIRQLPMVECNSYLSRGGRLEYRCGSIRRSNPDPRGFRAFVLEDKRSGIRYRIVAKGMVVEHDLSNPLFIKNKDRLKYTPFALEGPEGAVNSFLYLCDQMVEEYEDSKSLFSNLRDFSKEPFGKVLISAGFVYAVVTLVVLVLG